jgi:hypothetical protein
VVVVVFVREKLFAHELLVVKHACPLGPWGGLAHGYFNTPFI